MLKAITTTCLAQCLLCFVVDSDFLEFSPKFSHNMGYKLEPERAEMNYVNKSLGDVSIKVFVYNRTVKPFNMTLRFFTELSEEALIFVKVYQFKSNQYKLTAIQFPMKLHQMLQMEWFGLDLLASAAVPPLRWPLKVNVTYRICNWYPNSDLFTFSYNAVGKWKANTMWFLDSKREQIICDYDYYISVVERQ